MEISINKWKTNMENSENEFDSWLSNKSEEKQIKLSKDMRIEETKGKKMLSMLSKNESSCERNSVRENKICHEEKNVPRRFEAKDKNRFPPWKKLRINTTRARGELKLLKRLMKENDWIEEFQNLGDVMWSGLAEHEDTINFAEKAVVNRFPGMKELASKAVTGRMLKSLSKFFPEHFDIFPKTFVLPQEEEEAKSFMKKSKNVFIAKPSCSSQGNSIYLIKQLSEIPVMMRANDEIVIQEYINNPLLVDNKKFDLRIYVLLLGVEPLRGFLCDEGLARFCTKDYCKATPKNFKEQYVHLTNYSLNKLSEGFVYSEETLEKNNGTKRTLSSLWKSLAELGISEEQIMGKVAEVVRKFLHATLPFILYHYKTAFQGSQKAKCFQIIGFDIMFDEKLKPFLLEINNNPSLSVDHEYDDGKGNYFSQESPIDVFIKRQVVEDSLLLATNDSLSSIQLGDKCRSFTLIFQESQKDISGPATLFKSLLEVYGWLSGFKFRENLTASRFVKLATLPNMTDEDISKADYDLLYLKATRLQNDGFMDFPCFISAMEILAAKMEFNLVDLVEYILLQLDNNSCN